MKTLPRFINSHQGLTLPELLISIGLIGLVSLLAFTVYDAYLRVFTTQFDATNAASQNKIALIDITDDIRQSQSAVISCCSPTETTSNNELVLSLWSLDSNGNPTNTALDNIVYKTDPTNPTNLIKKTFPDPSSSRASGTKIITTYLDQLNPPIFTYDQAAPNTNYISTRLTVSITTNRKTQTVTKTALAGFRNK